MIKAIIWDMGGVLISEEVTSRAQWERRLRLAIPPPPNPSDVGLVEGVAAAGIFKGGVGQKSRGGRWPREWREGA